MEAAPTIQRDENVFDISQGVCILLCVKERDNPAPAKVYHADIWDSERINTIPFQRIISNPLSGMSYNRLHRIIFLCRK